MKILELRARSVGGVRYLIQRGCKTDILMAATIADAALVRRHPTPTAKAFVRVSDEYFPLINEKSGGTIHQ